MGLEAAGGAVLSLARKVGNFFAKVALRHQKPYPKGPRTQIIGSLKRGFRGLYKDIRELFKGPRT